MLAKGVGGGFFSGNQHGSMMVAHDGGRFQEAVLNGNVFYAMTAASGVAPGTALGTTAAFSLYNPNGSGKNLVIWNATLGRVSGTLGAGYVAWTYDPAQQLAAAPTGTAIVSRNALLNSARATTSAGQALTTATLANTPTQFRVAFNLAEEVVATTALMGAALIDDVEGAIVVTPGNYVALEGVAAAGTSPLVVYSVCWEEVDIV